MASNHLGPDAHLGPVLGFAIKIFGINGMKLVEDEPDSNTFDLVLKNNPTSSPGRSTICSSRRLATTRPSTLRAARKGSASS
jgi:hypothetical protein